MFSEKKFVSLLTDTGIPQASDFFFEVKEKMVAKLIPSQPPKNHLAYYFNHIFHKVQDAEWIASISKHQLLKLATLLELSSMQKSASAEGTLPQVLYSLEILTLRLSGRAMESSVVRMVPEYNNLESPFVGFQDELSRFQHQLITKPELLINPENIDYKQLNVLLQ